MTADERLLTLEQVAEFAQVGVKTVRREIAAGHLEAYRLDGRGTRGTLRVRRDAIDAWLAAKSTRRHQRPLQAVPRPIDPITPATPARSPRRGATGRLEVTEGMGRAA